MTDAQKLREYILDERGAFEHGACKHASCLPDVALHLLDALEKYGDYDGLVDHMGMQPDFVGPDDLCGLATQALAKAVEEIT